MVAIKRDAKPQLHTWKSHLCLLLSQNFVRAGMQEQHALTRTLQMASKIADDRGNAAALLVPWDHKKNAQIWVSAKH